MTTRMRRRCLLRTLGMTLGLCVALTLPPPQAEAQNDDRDALPPNGFGQSCGAVEVAVFEWPAAEVAAHVVERALRDGYGCLTALRRADPEQTLKVMTAAGGAGGTEIGARVVAPGIRGAKTGDAAAAPTIALGGALYGPGEIEGFFIPAWLAADHPELRSLADLPAFGRKMAAQGVRPALRLCPASWPCAKEVQSIVEQMSLARWFDVETPLSGAALVSAVEAAKQAPAAARRPWVSYFWAPSLWASESRLWPLKVGDVTYCAAKDACKPAFTRPRQRIAYATALTEKTPRLRSFLNNFQIPARAMSDVLAWRALNQADAAATARRLLANNRQLWPQWFDSQAHDAFARATPVSAEPPPQ